MRILKNREILDAQIALARHAKLLDIVSYNVDGRWGWMLSGTCPRTRLVVGYPANEGERRTAILSKAKACATSNARVCEVRALADCHVKLFIASLSGRERDTYAIVGSQNLGEGHTFELAVEFRGMEAHRFEPLFKEFWLLALPVKSHGEGVVKALSSSVFESQG